ncbi:MAG: histidine phosphatase family protein [Paenibacillus sp.]|nr:histidine phosphatase family protein [Paenibacillus sp.]
MQYEELELVLLRHGLTQWNAERRYLGQTDLSLLPSILEQLSGQKEQNGLLGDFWRVYSSDLLRCRETLACMMPAFRDVVVYDNRLREMNFGDWEGFTYEQLKSNSLYRSWLDEPWAITPPNGEAWEAFESRVDEFLSELLLAVKEVYLLHHESGAADGALSNAKSESVSDGVLPGHSPKRVLIVTHGGVIRQLLARTIPELTFRDAVAPSPGTVTVLKLLWRGGQWSAVTGKS